MESFQYTKGSSDYEYVLHTKKLFTEMLFGIPKIKHWTLFGLQRNMTKKNKVIVNKKTNIFNVLHFYDYLLNKINSQGLKIKING